MDVTSENFEQAFEDICSALKDSCFVAIDLEFTGLNGWPPSAEPGSSELWDDLNRRYQRMRRSAQDNRVLQVGLCLFHCDKDFNFSARPYNFNVFPECTCETIGLLEEIQDTFSCQTQSIRFLARNNFDFNKCFLRGVPYLNGAQENLLHEALSGVYLYDDILEEVRSFIRDGKNEALTVWLPQDRSAFVTEAYLKEMFPGAVINASGCRSVEIRQGEFSKEAQVNPDVVFEKIRGFRRVFMEVIKSRVPIVGHNCLMDLTMMYQAFFQPLPEDVDLFLSRVHSDVFPLLWDTKYIIKTLKSGMSDVFQGTPVGLVSLYDHLCELWKKFNSMPQVSIPPQYNRYLSDGSTGAAQEDGLPEMKKSHAAHEAGYDAWMTGVCLIRMVSLMTTSSSCPCRIDESNLSEASPFSKYRVLLSSFDNCVNMICGPNAIVNFSLQVADHLPSAPTFEYKIVSKNPDWSFLRSALKDLDMCEVDPLREIVTVRGELARTNVEKLLQSDKVSSKGISAKLVRYRSIRDWFAPLRRARGLVLNGGVLAIGVAIGVGLTISCRRR